MKGLVIICATTANCRAPPVTLFVSSTPRSCAHRKLIVVVISIQLREQSDLLKIVQTAYPDRLLFGTRQRGQQHGRQDRDYGNYDQQFN